mgnify:CR=1 FL=1
MLEIEPADLGLMYAFLEECGVDMRRRINKARMPTADTNPFPLEISSSTDHGVELPVMIHEEQRDVDREIQKLIVNSGWKDELKKHCLQIIRQKGLEQINLEDLVEELLPKGRALVPTGVKEDLLGQIKGFLENDEDYRKLTGF